LKGFTKNNQFHPITDYKKKSSPNQVAKQSTGVRLKRSIGRLKSLNERVNKNLDLVERYYIEKDVSLSDRENAIAMIKRDTGMNPRMFGNTRERFYKKMKVILIGDSTLQTLNQMGFKKF
jgi:hypothetical protein